MRFLITAGPTREHFDPVRYISNRSSGKMGYALAEAARAVGGEVTLVSGPTALTPPAQVEFVAVTSAAEMADAVFARFPNADVVIMAAAVCDFRPKQVADHKLKKTTLGADLTLALEPTTDILAELGRRKQSQVLVGFAVETQDLAAYAQDKLRRKNLDFIVGNHASAFDRDTNVVTLWHADGRREDLPEMAKSAVAVAIIERIVAIRP